MKNSIILFCLAFIFCFSSCQQKVKPEGFDLIFGNPPWLKFGWDDAPVVKNINPVMGVSDKNSAVLRKERDSILSSSLQFRKTYRGLFESTNGSAKFLGDITLYPKQAGTKVNLYKNFCERSWGLIGSNGVSGGHCAF